MAWKYQGRILRAGRAWQSNDGSSHPANWLATTTNEQKAAAGVTWEDDPAPYDSKFWIDAKTPKSLDDVKQVDDDGKAILDRNGKQEIAPGLKSVWKARTKQEANHLLQGTDWKAVKASEVSDYSMDKETADYRAAVRKASNDIEAKIDAAANHTAFLTLFDVPLDSDKKPTGNPPMYDWPDPLD